MKKGASSGIGQATAILFSKKGAKLVLVGRNESKLDETIQKCQKENVSWSKKLISMAKIFEFLCHYKGCESCWRSNQTRDDR